MTSVIVTTTLLVPSGERALPAWHDLNSPPQKKIKQPYFISFVQVVGPPHGPPFEYQHSSVSSGTPPLS